MQGFLMHANACRGITCLLLKYASGGRRAVHFGGSEDLEVVNLFFVHLIVLVVNVCMSLSVFKFSVALFALTICVTFSSFSQSPLLKIAAHKHPSKAFKDSIYMFPAFQEGTITFSTGFSPDQRITLNYNMYHFLMDFINENGDTMQMKPSPEIKEVTIGKHLFYYDSKVGYIEMLDQSPVALGVLTFLNTEKMQYVSGAIINAETDTDARGRPSAYDRYYSKRHTYYFIDTKNKAHKAYKVYKAIKPSLARVFREQRREIDAYCKVNKIDFNNSADLTRLLGYCNGLDAK